MLQNEKSLLSVTGLPGNKSPTPSVPEANQLSDQSKMCWFLLFTILIWLLTAMIATVVAICLIQSYLSLSLFSTLAPPVILLNWIVKRLFPIDERSYEIKIKEIDMKIQIQSQRPSKIRLINRAKIQKDGQP